MTTWSNPDTTELIALIQSGMPVTTAAKQTGISPKRAFAIAYELGLVKKRKFLTEQQRAQVVECFREEMKPTDIARKFNVDTAIIYRIGIKNGLWHRHTGRYSDHITSRRCHYLLLLLSGHTRTQAAEKVGYSKTTIKKIEKGIARTSRGTAAFIPTGPDASLYIRLMYFTKRTDGFDDRAIVELPNDRVDQVISSRYLSRCDREVICDLHKQGLSMRAIARRIGKNVSTVSRELKRGATEVGGAYVPSLAHRKSVVKRMRPKRRKAQINPQLMTTILEWTELAFSPQQIAGRLKVEFPDDPSMHVCHETIYQLLYALAKDGVVVNLGSKLRRGRSARRSRYGRRKQRRFVDEMPNIADRPDDVEDRCVPGHWEGDLILGKGNRSAIATLVERSTRHVLLVPLPHRHDSAAVLAALIEAFAQVPAHLKKSLTWDQGGEMALHKPFSVLTGCPVFFCDAGSPWQRGSNENTNGLLRQFFQKGSDLSLVPVEEVKRVQDLMNNRPRKVLDFATPKECFDRLLA